MDALSQLAVETVKNPNVITAIYGDLLKPGVTQVGKALGTVIGLGNTALWPIQLLNERSRIFLERNLEKYRESLENIPEEKIIEVSPEIGVPIAEKLSFVQDETLSTLYVSLLATASSIDTIKYAHPSYVNIINNLCPDEARMITNFQEAAVPCITKKWVSLDRTAVDENIFTLPGQFIGVQFPENLPAYLSNLIGLGLLNISRNLVMVNANYEGIEQYVRSNPLLHNDNPFPTAELCFDRHYLYVTSFGLAFSNACHLSSK